MKSTDRKSKHDRIVAIATLGVSLALIVALHALSKGVKFGPFSLALGLIPVLAISQLKDWHYGLILGTFFGVVSLLSALIEGKAGVAVWHNQLNPLVSVLPRAIVGLACSLLSMLAYKIVAKIETKNAAKGEVALLAVEDEADTTAEQPVAKAPVTPNLIARKVGKWTVEYLIHAVITLVGVLINTVGFLGMLILFARGETVNGAAFNLLYVLEFVVGTNTLIEVLVFTFLVPAIILALKRAKVFR